MALLSTQVVRRLQANAPTFGAAAGGGDTFVPDSRTFVYLKIGSTATVVTFQVPTARDVIPDVDISNVVLASVTSQDRICGPFPAEIFADPTTGLASIGYSQVTGVTVGVFQLSS